MCCGCCGCADVLAMQVEVAFFLDHWGDIRSSEAMRNVWQQIRLGRHPGFEEGARQTISRLRDADTAKNTVWPLIALNLEFRPHSPGVEGRDVPTERS